MELTTTDSKKVLHVFKRKEWMYNVSRFCSANIFMKSYYDIYAEGLENIPSSGPALLLPKHQSMSDIVLEAYLLSLKDRKGNWIMKTKLPGFLEYLGGIEVKRGKDVIKLNKNGERSERKKLVDEAKKCNQSAMDYIKWLFLCGEIVVVHPEGTRINRKVGQIKTEYVNLTKELWEKYELAIPIIPVGIEYENIGVPRSRVYLRAGTSLDVRKDNLAELVRLELTALSNLPYPGN